MLLYVPEVVEVALEVLEGVRCVLGAVEVVLEVLDILKDAHYVLKSHEGCTMCA